MFLVKISQATILLSVITHFHFSYARCGPFDLEKEKSKIPIIVSGVVLSSAEVILPMKVVGKKNQDIFAEGGKKYIPVPAPNAKKEHNFSFKVTAVKKGYLREGEVINFKYLKSNYACPSTQTPKANEHWQLNISEIDESNLAKPYGTHCSYLGFQTNLNE